MSGKNIDIYFFTCGSKINKFKWKKLEKTTKKNPKNLKVAGNCPNI